MNSHLCIQHITFEYCEVFLPIYPQTDIIHSSQTNYTVLSLINYSLPVLLPRKASSIKHLMVFMGSRGKKQADRGCSLLDCTNCIRFNAENKVGQGHLKKKKKVLM